MAAQKSLFILLEKRPLKNFMRLGFPTTKVEEWRYTDISALKDSPFELAHSKETPCTLNAIEGLPTINVHLVNGKPVGMPQKTPTGLRVESLRVALKGKNSKMIEEILSSDMTENSAKDSGHEAFLSLNTAFVDDGIVIWVSERAEISEVLRIVFENGQGQQNSIAHPRVIVVAEAGSSFTLIEEYRGPRGTKYCNNSVVNFYLNSGALVDHYRIQEEGLESFHLSLIRADLQRTATFRTHTFSFGGKLARNQVEVFLKGEGCNVTMNGLTVINGSQHIDNQTLLDNEAPHCESLELYKGVYGEKSEGVFSGTIIVRPDAQKTNAIQSNRSLLLSNDAVVNTKPQLKIWADDVKCTHGATVGQLDEEALFYLRSRGISEQAARDMLIVAFASEIIGQVKIEALQDHLEKLVHHKLWNS